MEKESHNQKELTSLLQKEISEVHFYPYSKISSNILNIKNLLSKGADINSTDSHGDTLLHHIVSSKTIKAYNAYIKETLHVNPIEKTNYLLDLSTILSTNHPDPFIKNKDGKTPLDIVLEKKLTREAKILIAYENAYSAFVNEKQINTIINTQSPLIILTRQRQRQKQNNQKQNY